jgi:hypothetical protein
MKQAMTSQPHQEGSMNSLGQIGCRRESRGLTHHPAWPKLHKTLKIGKLWANVAISLLLVLLEKSCHYIPCSCGRRFQIRLIDPSLPEGLVRPALLQLVELDSILLVYRADGIEVGLVARKGFRIAGQVRV